MSRLQPCSWFSGRPGPLLLIIMDGIGIGRQDDSDGVFLARTPHLDAWRDRAPVSLTLQAHGTAVGMPSDEDMGNSEVGHNALGAGRVFAQGAKLVSRAIADGRIFEGAEWRRIVEAARKEGGTLHLIGLLSDGNVHSHIDHLFALLRRAADEGVRRARVHALLDGRDVYEKSALTYIARTEEVLAEINRRAGYDYRIASGGGRMVTTMDRYQADWAIVERGWKAHVLGEARGFPSAAAAVETFYEEDPTATDQYLPPFVVTEGGEPVGRMRAGDAVVFFNFRGDRAIEISRAFEEEDFHEFDRGLAPEVVFAGMMEYDGDLHIPRHYLVSPPRIDHPVGEYLCAAGVRSFAISETQKFGHVTYFWNGNNSGYIDERLETYIEIPSDKVRFDEAPKMKAEEITEKTVALLESGEYRFGRLNFANGDMVGHTGVRDAILTAVETVDACAGRLVEVVERLGGVTVILADHGNADELYTIKNGKKTVSTAHSLNPVPFVILDGAYRGEYRPADLSRRGLSNVAATLLNLLGFEKPDDYDPSLIGPGD